MTKQSNIYCNNCSNKGHNYHNCKQPITSLGIITYRYNNEKKEYEYLMIRRRNSLGFVDFIRGKYNIYNKSYIMNIINEMTVKEKKMIIENDFDYLWNYLWNNNTIIKYSNEELSSKEKFNILKSGVNTLSTSYSLDSLINSSNTKWEEEEWGFPKGRRNFQEKDIVTATREFTEETGILSSNINIIMNVVPFEEIFTGSNFKSYKHKYFIACIKDNNIKLNNYQKSEVSKVEWKTFYECIKCIRSYNKEKMLLIDKINKMLLKYKIY